MSIMLNILKLLSKIMDGVIMEIRILNPLKIPMQKAEIFLLLCKMQQTLQVDWRIIWKTVILLTII